MTQPGMTLQRTARVAAEGFTLLEAPRWHDGMLWLSDFYSHRVLRADVAGSGEVRPEQVCIVEGRPSGLGFMPDGELRISSMLDKRLLAWNGRRTEVVADYADLVTGPGNDLVIDSAGVSFVGNFGLDPADDQIALPTSLLRVAPDGTVTVAADDVVFPNGMVIDESAGVLYAVESFRARITAWDYSAGELSNRRVWVAFGEDAGGPYDIPALTETYPLLPDGIARDAEGMIWVADAKGHGARRVAADGTVAEFVDTGELSVYAVALGGEARDELFLCCAPRAESWNRLGAPRSVLMRCRVDIPGV
jgi:sugar lactone lactonase YvrE